ncbi:MAG: hypothetical protein AAB499_00025 [Patescibacteria group bacterium]
MASNSDSLTISVQELVEKDFFTLAGLEKLSDAEKDALLENILNTIRNRVVIRIIESFPESERLHLDSVLQGEDEEQISTLLTNKHIDVDRLVAEESLTFKSQLLRSLAEIKPSHA